MYLSEEEIIDGCLRKKRTAQKALYDRYHPVLLGICLRYSKSRAEAEDTMLMGLNRIYKKIDTYHGEGSFEGWMKRIVVNMAIDNYRKNLKHYFHEPIENASSFEIGYDYIPDTFSVKEILSTIQQLPLGYKLVFNMFAIEGYSHKEIAEKLNISESTSKTQLLKARKRLREKLVLLNKEVTKPQSRENEIRIELGRII